MEQLNMFQVLLDDYKITKPVRLIELFAGYGSQALALKYLGVKFSHWKICEWAVKSIQAYKDIHFNEDNNDYSQLCTKEQLIDYLAKKGISSNYNEPMTYEQIKRLNEKQLRTIYNNIIATRNLVNISQVKAKDLDICDTENYDYIMTYSFPCQDLSLAGKQKGMEKGSSTRSGLLWEVERILEECHKLGNMPQILLMENVPQVVGSKNINDFKKWLAKLESLGYSNYCETINAKDYLIPQNRERTFMISILGNYNYNFPSGETLKKRLKDLLEENVDERYYLSSKTIQQISKWNSYQNPLDSVMGKKSLCPTITTRIAESQDGGINASMKVLSDDLENTTNVLNEIKRADILLNKIINENEINEFPVCCDATLNEPKIREISNCIISRYDAGIQNQKSVGLCVIDNVENKSFGEIKKIGNYSPSGHNASSIIDTNGIAPTVMENHDTVTAIVENKQCGVIIPEATAKGYAIAYDGDGVYINRPHQKRGCVQKGMIQTLKTSPDVGVVVNNDKNNINQTFKIANLLFNIFDLCVKIDLEESDKYEKNRNLLQVLWETIRKKEVWEAFRRFWCFPKKEILQQRMYEQEFYDDRKSQSKIPTSSSNSSEYNEIIKYTKEMFDMWESWKIRYTPSRWELSEQQFREFNLSLQELSYETTQEKTNMQDLWQANERIGLLQQTLFEIQKIWGSSNNKIQNNLRIRKLTPREVFRLMGVKDEDYENVAKNQSNASLYHLAGDSIVTTCLMAIFSQLFDNLDWKGEW